MIREHASHFSFEVPAFKVPNPRVSHTPRTHTCVINGQRINAWSELAQTTLRPLWPHQAKFLVSKTVPWSLKKLILTSHGGQLKPFSASAICTDIIAGAILLVNHHAQLLYRSSLFTSYRSEHNPVRIIVVRHSIAKVIDKRKYTHIHTCKIRTGPKVLKGAI